MNTNSLRMYVNTYLEWLRNDKAMKIGHVFADIRGRVELAANEKTAIRYWVRKCLKEGRYM